MAAVRRSSGSGIVVALVIFFVLAVTGISTAFYFYQQAARARTAIETNQLWFERDVAQIFADSNWELPTQSPAQEGFTYAQEAYRQVAEKLQEAAEYEKEMLPLLGWNSLPGVRDALEQSAIQADVRQAQGQALATVNALLSEYETQYGQLTTRVAELTRDQQSLSDRVETLEADLGQAQRTFNQDLSQARQEFNRSVQEKTQENQRLNALVSEKEAAAADWRDRYNQEVAQREREVSDLNRAVAAAQEELRLERLGPGELERMEAEGQVVELRPRYGFVLVQGGRNQEMKENDRLIIYQRTPDGQDHRKAIIVVGQVYDDTSLATVAEQDRPILEDDLYVSVGRWLAFHPEDGPELKLQDQG